LGLQRIHWYPASFPPAIPGTLIDILGSGTNYFLDPFCGSGVAPIEAWLRGNIAVGIDNNPLAIEIGRAKIDLIRMHGASPCESLVEDYFSYRKKALSRITRTDPEATCERAQLHADATRWFIPSVLTEIGILKNWINSKRSMVAKWGTVLRVVLSSLLHREFSIARRYHYSYVVDRSRVKEEARDHVDVPALFVSRLRASFLDAELLRDELRRSGASFPDAPAPTLVKASAQELGSHIAREIDLVVTSPPYFGMNDYVRSQYLSWLIFQWPRYEDDIAAESGSRRSRWSQRGLETYMTDMQRTFRALFAALTRGGYLALVIGRSTTKLAAENDPVPRLRSALLREGYVEVWSGYRRVQFRKINNIPYRDEYLWVFQRE
jgi:hypothetical protein